VDGHFLNVGGEQIRQKKYT